MSPSNLTSLLRRASTGNPPRTPACPDEEQIAAYVDGTAEPGERERLELDLGGLRCLHRADRARDVGANRLEGASLNNLSLMYDELGFSKLLTYARQLLAAKGTQHGEANNTIDSGLGGVCAGGHHDVACPCR